MAGHDMEKFAKLSTRLWQNEKVRVFAMEHPSAFSVWTFAISYCAGELNDGELSRFHLKCLLGASDEDIDALIDAHLLDEHEDGTLWLHDFVAAQGRSRADVEEAKAKKAEAGRKRWRSVRQVTQREARLKQNEADAKHKRSRREARLKQNEADAKHKRSRREARLKQNEADAKHKRSRREARLKQNEARYRYRYRYR